MKRYTIREHKYESDSPMARLQDLENKVEDGEIVEVAHGSWGFDGIGWTCSECGEYALSIKTNLQVHSIYCPHCGAKMDGERSENGKRTDN